MAAAVLVLDLRESTGVKVVVDPQRLDQALGGIVAVYLRGLNHGRQQLGHAVVLLQTAGGGDLPQQRRKCCIGGRGGQLQRRLGLRRHLARVVADGSFDLQQGRGNPRRCRDGGQHQSQRKCRRETHAQLLGSSVPDLRPQRSTDASHSAGACRNPRQMLPEHGRFNDRGGPVRPRAPAPPAPARSREGA